MSELTELAGREFSFYPSIEGVETNLWELRDSNWSEFLVRNTGDGKEVWIPRRYLGEISSTDRPVTIVGLNRSLQMRAGQVWPVQKQVVAMPRVPAGEKDTVTASAAEIDAKQAAMTFRLDAGEKKIGRLIGVALAVAILLVAGVVFFSREKESGGTVAFEAVVQQSLGLEAGDDYFAVVRRLGEPEADRWKGDGESMQYRVLVYPKQNLNVILAGRERKEARYIGALDGQWRPVDSVAQKGGSNTYSVLKRLPRF